MICAERITIKHIRKIAIIGAGYVGASIAYALMLRELADEIVLIDVNKEHAQGEALDIIHGISYMGACRIFQGDYADCHNCDIIIITAGKNRKYGQTRLDLAEDNSLIMENVVAQIRPFYNNAVVLVVANPVDILTYKVAKNLNAEKGKVLGTGCLLDTSRLVCRIADYVGLSSKNIQAMVVGEHGEHQLPLWSRVSVANSPIAEYCEMLDIPWNQQIRDKIMHQVKTMGAEIISRKERTHYGIATCVCYLVDTIMNNHPTVVPVSGVLEQEYAGVKDIAISVPSIVGDGGIWRQLYQEWNVEEITQFQESGRYIREIIEKIKI